MATPQQSPPNAGYQGSQDQHSGSSDFNSLQFVIQQALSRISTFKTCKVVSVSTDANGLPWVVLQPLVNQIDGSGNMVAHGQLQNVPVIRLQAGTFAIIIDPQVGDIGGAFFCDRDISTVKSTKAQANPASRRYMDWADGIYLGGLLNGTPTDYVKFDTDGLHIVSPTKIFLAAPTVAVTGDLTVTGDITAGQGTGDQIGVRTHKHPTAAIGAPSSPTAGT